MVLPGCTPISAVMLSPFGWEPTCSRALFCCPRKGAPRSILRCPGGILHRTVGRFRFRRDCSTKYTLRIRRVIRNNRHFHRQSSHASPVSVNATLLRNRLASGGVPTGRQQWVCAITQRPVGCLAGRFFVALPRICIIGPGAAGAHACALARTAPARR